MSTGTDQQEREERWRMLSGQLQSQPEVAFQEYRAHELLCAELSREGFSVQRNYIFSTGFRATFQLPPEPADIDGLTVGLVCEYDALPELGHACGHHLVAVGALATASAVRRLMQSCKPRFVQRVAIVLAASYTPQEEQLHGRLVVLGTPGSESGRRCCKARLLEQGAFAGIDALLALHPAAPEIGCCVAAGREGPCQWLEFRFRGAAAADAAILAYWSLASGARGVLSSTGKAPCEPTTCSESQYVLLADNDAQLKERRRAAEDALLGTAKATGCLLECRFGKPRPWPIFNAALEQLFAAQLHKPGVASGWFPCCCGRWCGAWSDWGAVSRALPCLRATFPLPGASGAPHSRAFAAAVTTPQALRATLDAAAALAATATHIFRQRDMRNISPPSTPAYPPRP